MSDDSGFHAMDTANIKDVGVNDDYDVWIIKKQTRFSIEMKWNLEIWKVIVGGKPLAHSMQALLADMALYLDIS